MKTGKTYELRFTNNGATMLKLIGGYNDESGTWVYEQNVIRIDPMLPGRHVVQFKANHDYVVLNTALSPSSETITDVELYIVGQPMN